MGVAMDVDVELRWPVSELGEDEALLRETVRRFARKEIAPLVREMDEAQKMSGALIAKLFAQGLMGIEIPEEFGGVGGTFFQSIVTIEEISAVDPAVGVLVDVQNTLTINALLRWGTGAQKAQWLPRLATDTICSYALSEASSGSDAFALKTAARREGDEYVINGSKLWISNAAEAGLFIVFATVDAGAGLQGDYGVPGGAGCGGTDRGEEGRQAGDSSELDVRAAVRRVQGARDERAGGGGQGIQDCDRDAERRADWDCSADAGAWRRGRGSMRRSMCRNGGSSGRH